MGKRQPPASEAEMFNRHLEDLLRTGQFPTSDVDPAQQQMLRVAQALLDARVSSMSKARASVRHELFRHSRKRSKRAYSVRKLAAITLLLPLAAFVVACAVSPTLRARTKEVLLQIGHLVFTREPTNAQQAEPYFNTPMPTPVIEETRDPQRWAPLTQKEASNLVGFQVLVPRSVPEQEWERAFRPEWGNPKKVSWTIYEAPAGGIYVHCDCFRFHFVAIRQQRVEEGRLEEIAVADAQIREVELRGSRGYWIEDAPTGIVGGGGSIWSLTEDDIVWQISNQNYLVWEENGIVYRISGSDELSLEDYLLVANSLAP